MTWTTPRTWAAGELVTATLLNQQTRDNSRYLHRAINGHVEAVVDHFEGALAAGWSWPIGTPATVDLSSNPSCLRIAHTNIVDTQLLARSSSTGSVTARVCVGSDSFIGVRLDDGGANYVDLRLEQDGVGRKRLLLYVSGGPTTTLLSGLAAEWIILRIVKDATTAYCYYDHNSPAMAFLGGASAAWTSTRMSIVFGQRGAATADRAGFVDWIV